MAAAAQPLGSIDNLTVLSSEGATDLVRTGTRTVAEAAASVKALTGIDIPALLGDRFGSDGSDGGSRGPAPSASTSTSTATSGDPGIADRAAASVADMPSAPTGQPDEAMEEALRRAGAFLRQIPRIEQFRDTTLGELPALLPGRVRPSVERARDRLPNAVIAMTVGEILDRTG